jgi:hypothetical protein
LPSLFIFWKSGDSLSFSRIQTEMASRMIDRRNGMRQPQLSKSSVDIDRRQARITRSDRKRPAANAINAKMKAAVGFTPEKNCLLMTAASEP